MALLWNGLEADLEAADGGGGGLVLHLGQPRLVAHLLPTRCCCLLHAAYIGCLIGSIIGAGKRKYY